MARRANPFKNTCRILFGRKRRQHLRRPPRRMVAGVYRPDELDHDTARLFITLHARSPHNVRALLKKHNVRTVSELIPLLPDNHYHVDPRRRLMEWARRLFGFFSYEPTVSRLDRDLERIRQRPTGHVLARAEPPPTDKPP